MTTTAALGELPHMLTFAGDLRGKDVLDLGCADPVLTTEVVSQKPRCYHGLAGSESLRDAVRLAGAPAEAEETDIDQWPGDGLGTFDVVVSARAVQHVRNIARLLETLYHHVAPGGRLVFSVTHPAISGKTASGQTAYFQEGERPHLPSWCGRPVRHRTFETYIRELGYCGFRLIELSEGRAEQANDTLAPQWAVFRCARR